ncbi:MAG: HD domain-containing protein [bacterium]|nr:HD domain-containing protein [bacterium]
MSSKKSDYLNFFKTVGKSKRLLRTGWIENEIKDPESIAEHSFRAGVLAMVMADKMEYPLDKNKLIKMALLHDLGELATGDIIVGKGEVLDIKKRDEKEKQEEEDIRTIFGLIGEGDKYAAIFDEMITRSTPEARFFWQIDKLEMALQALEYEKEQGKNLEQFFLGVGSLHLKEPLLKKIFNEIIKSRKKEYQASLAKKLGGKI